MVSRFPIWVVMAMWIWSPAESIAQRPAPRPPTDQQASLLSGRLSGVVQDELGIAIGGVRVCAIGATIAISATDAFGRFSVSLPAGQYLLRAERPGYLRTRDELIRVGPAGQLERRITMLRDDFAEQPAPAEPPLPSDIAWRLRHLSRTVLREVPHAPANGTGGSGEAGTAVTLDDQHVAAGPIEAVSSFFTDTPFTGQLNFFTTSPVISAGTAGGRGASGIAEVLIGAPVGSVGDWHVRGALSSGATSSWVVLGEYVNRPDRPNGMHVAVAYRSQTEVAAEPVLHATPPEPRTAAAVRVSNRWQLRPWLTMSHAVRFDRDDLVMTSGLFSPEAALRAEVAPRTSVTVSAKEDVRAPGTTDLLPASSGAPWSAPIHVFSAAATWQGFPAPERVREWRIGAERALGETDTSMASVEWFSQHVADQMAMVFGARGASRPEQYGVASVGDAHLEGWRVGAVGTLMDQVRGAVELVSAEARWVSRGRAGEAWLSGRTGTDRLAEMQTSVTWTVPRTATMLAFTHRLSAAWRVDQEEHATALRRQHVALEFQQRAPFQPLEYGIVNVFLAVRTSFSDDRVSLYDELLTFQSPARLSGGLQIQF